LASHDHPRSGFGCTLTKRFRSRGVSHLYKIDFFREWLPVIPGVSQGRCHLCVII
jgi:hypothetical protein